MARHKQITVVLAVTVVITFAILGYTLFKNRKPNSYIHPGSLLEESVAVMKLIKNNDLVNLATHIHPEIGVRFSPWPFITEKDQIFSPSQLVSLMTDSTIYQWGSSPAGEILLTYGEYCQKYIYDHDFFNPGQIILNKAISTGATINNIHQFYPKASFVLFHFDGFNPEYEGMDWASLYLIFLNEDDKWFLVGIAHDNWIP